MSYAEALSKYRLEFKRYLEANDKANARLYAILYAKLLREIGEQISSYTDRAKISVEAQKYDLFAAMITKYGITDEVKKAISNGEMKISAPPAGSTNKPKRSSASAPKEPEESPPLPAKETSGEDADWGALLFEKYAPATLIVRTNSGVGTGFFITEDGYLLTNHHVIHDGPRRETYITVESGDGKIRGEVEFLKADKTYDVALLKLKTPGKTPFIPIIKDYSKVRPGLACMIIGNGLNFGLAPAEGTVKFPSANHSGNLVHTTPSNNGDSGSPVLNTAGECIGIHKSSTVWATVGTKRVDVVGLTNATSAKNIRMLLSRWGLEGKI